MREIDRAKEQERPYLKSHRAWDDACPYCDQWLVAKYPPERGGAAFTCGCSTWRKELFEAKWTRTPLAAQ